MMKTEVFEEKNRQMESRLDAPDFSTIGSVLPLLTNEWTRVNYVDTEPAAFQPAPYSQGSYQEKEAVHGSLSRDLDPEMEERLAQSDHGISAELLRINRENCNFSLHADLEEGDDLRIDLPLSSEEPALYDRIQLHGVVGNRASCLVRLYSTDGTPAVRNGVIHVEVDDDAELNLYLVQQLNDQSLNELSLVARVGDGGKLNIYHIELGSRKTNFHYGADLAGLEAASHISTAYIAQGKEELDLYYHIRLLGQFSEAHVVCDGALMDEAKKSFRGTLNFLRGCTAARGDESETALLLNKKVKSTSVPILLCTEDDVVGDHAASAGQIDEEVLFYLMSRGLSRKEAESLLVESRIKPTIDQLPDPVLRDRLLDEVHERMVSHV